MVYFFIFCALVPQGMYSIIFGRERGGDRRSWLILSFWYQNTEKRNNALSQMRLRSVFKMRMSILNTATTEHLGCILFSFFVYIKSINQYFSLQMPLPTLLVSYNRLDKCNVNYCFLEKVNKSQKLRVVV